VDGEITFITDKLTYKGVKIMIIAMTISAVLAMGLSTVYCWDETKRNRR
jgi:hypothetical protein